MVHATSSQKAFFNVSLCLTPCKHKHVAIQQSLRFIYLKPKRSTTPARIIMIIIEGAFNENPSLAYLYEKVCETAQEFC